MARRKTYRRFKKRFNRSKRSFKRSTKKKILSGSTFQHSFVLRTGDLNGQELLVDGTGASFDTSADYYNIIVPSAGATVPFYVTAGMNFQFRDIANYQDFQNIYDEYRIKGVKIKIIPMSNTAIAPEMRWRNDGTPGVFANSIVPILHDAIDINDSNAPIESDFGLAVGALRRYKTYKERHFYAKQHIRFLKPKIMNDNINMNTKWLSCSNNASEPHFGYKFILELPNLPREIYAVTPSTYTFSFKIEYTYYIQFRQPVR